MFPSPNQSNSNRTNSTIPTSSNLEIFRRSILSNNPNSRLRITVNLPSTSTSDSNLNDMYASTSSGSRNSSGSGTRVPLPSGTPLSGSNRVQASTRSSRGVKFNSKLEYERPNSTSSSSTGKEKDRNGVTDLFPIPNYLIHSNYYDRFFTVESMKGLYNHEEEESSLTSTLFSVASSSKGKGKKVLKLEDRIQLPTQWSLTDKCALLEVTSNNLTVSFGGSAKYGDRDAASIRSNHPIPTTSSIYYYEIQVLSSGQSGYIGFGLSTSQVNLSRLPGWEKGSWAWHADDGRSFEQSGTGEVFSTGWGNGDVVGCGVDWTHLSGEERAGRCFFTKNGKFIKYVFSGLKGDLYPTVGLRTPGESVEVNFGAKPFKFDINSFVLERKRSISKSISQTKIPPSLFLPSTLPPLPPPSIISTTPKIPITEDEKLRITMEELISDYLIHSGFTKTSESFRTQLIEERAERSYGIGFDASTCTESKNDEIEVDDEEEEDIKMVESSLILDGQQSNSLWNLEADARQRSVIYQLILAGKASEALKLLKDQYFNILTVSVDETMKTDGDGGIYFKLMLRIFIEAVLDCSVAGSVLVESSTQESNARAAKLDTLLELGRSLHSDYSSSPNLYVQGGLKVAFSLMAYSDPKDLAVIGGDVFSQDARITLADDVNAKILISQSLPPQSHLEAITRHVTATIGLLGDEGVGEAGLVDVDAELFSLRQS